MNLMETFEISHKDFFFLEFHHQYRYCAKFIESSFCSQNKSQRGLVLKTLRHCNCFENFWSKTKRQNESTVCLGLTFFLLGK